MAYLPTRFVCTSGALAISKTFFRISIVSKVRKNSQEYLERMTELLDMGHNIDVFTLTLPRPSTRSPMPVSWPRYVHMALMGR